MSKNKTVWLAILTMLLWGSLFPLVKLSFSSYKIEGTADILLFAGIRFIICGIIICVFSGLKDKSSFRIPKNCIFPILLSGVFSIVLHYGFSYLGLELTESSKTALLKQIGSVLYVCFSFLFIKDDKPTARKIIAALIGFLGIFILNLDSNGFSFSIGDLLIILSSVCTIFSNVISKKVFERVSPLAGTGISQLFGGIVLFAIGSIMGGRVTIPFDSSLLLFVYICLASIVSYCIWYGIVKNGELSRLFIIKFAEPVFAALLGSFILGENILRAQYLIAFLLVILSITISSVRIGQKA